MASQSVSHAGNGKQAPSLLALTTARFGRVRHHAPRSHAPVELPPNGVKLVRMKTIVEKYSLCPSTLRNATKSGLLRCYRTSGGFRRFDERDILKYLNVEVENPTNGNTPQLLGVIRVSSRKQSVSQTENGLSSLEHQRKRVNDYALQKYNRGIDRWYESVGSGLNFERKNFLEMIMDVVSGRLSGSILIASTPDRICRFGRTLVEYLAGQHGVSIEYVLRDKELSENESLAEDIISILTSFSAKASGNKNKKILSLDLPEEALKIAYGLKVQHYSNRYIAKTLEERGFRDKNNNPFIHSLIGKKLNKHWKVLSSLYGGEDNTKNNSFIDFVYKHISKTGDSSSTSKRSIIAGYRTFCKKNKLEEMSPRSVGTLIKSLGWKTEIRYNGMIFYLGVVIHNN